MLREFGLLLLYPATFLTVVLLPRKMLQDGGGGLINFMPLIYWALQWLNFWLLTAASILLWKDRQIQPSWPFYAALGLWLFCVIFALPKYEQSGWKKQFGIYHYVRFTLENYHFNHHVYFSLKEKKTLGDITLEEGTRVYLNDDKSLRSAELSTPHEIRGMLLTGSFSLSDQGWIEKAVLARDALIGGYPCGPGPVEFYREGDPDRFNLGKPYKFGSRELPPGVTVRLSKGILWRVEAPEPIRLDGILFAGGMSAIYFYPSGRIETGYLAEDSAINGFPLEKEMLFGLSEKGEVMHGWLTEKKMIGSVPVRGQFAFHKGRNHLKMATLAADHVIQGLPIARGEIVEFHESGKMKRVRIARSAVYEGQAFRAGDTIWFAEDGAISGSQPED